MSGVPDILSEVAPRRNYFLGLDFSTQQVVENSYFFFTPFLWLPTGLFIAFVSQLKAVVVDEKLKVLHEAAVNFDRNLPEYRLDKKKFNVLFLKWSHCYNCS